MISLAHSGQFSSLFVWVALLSGTASATAQPIGEADAAHRGEYVYRAAGCASCHTDTEKKGPPLAGGVALKTPFGTFYTPNITPDPVHGIGKWTEADLRRALHRGESPDGRNYYPAFPYPSYTGMSDADIHDLYAFLRTQPASDKAPQPHELAFPFGWRFLLTGWKMLFFTEGHSLLTPGQSPEVARGAYLVGSLSHCGECHTERGRLGGLDDARWLAGAQKGPTGGSVPNITPDRKTGIGDWSEGDIVELLTSGTMPNDDTVRGDMGPEVENSTKYLTDGDRRAIARYLKSIPAIDHEIK